MGVGLSGEVGREVRKTPYPSPGGGVGGGLDNQTGTPYQGGGSGSRKWGPRSFSDLLEEDPSPALAQPPAHFSLSLLSQPRPCGAGQSRGDWGEARHLQWAAGIQLHPAHQVWTCNLPLLLSEKQDSWVGVGRADRLARNKRSYEATLASATPM